MTNARHGIIPYTPTKNSTFVFEQFVCHIANFHCLHNLSNESEFKVAFLHSPQSQLKTNLHGNANLKMHRLSIQLREIVSTGNNGHNNNCKLYKTLAILNLNLRFTTIGIHRSYLFSKYN